jgi:hypothetical protein
MKTLTRTICLTLTLLLGSVGTSWGADFDKELAQLRYENNKQFAELGVADAQYNLGKMYYFGKGVPQDYKTAVKWFTLAAEQGYARAQYSLGLMYALGVGVIQDNVYALMWWNIAASSGHKSASKNRDIDAKRMTPSQLEKAQNLARECVRKNYKGC